MFAVPRQQRWTDVRRGNDNDQALLGKDSREAAQLGNRDGALDGP
jgi:hypothetical protein